MVKIWTPFLITITENLYSISNFVTFSQLCISIPIIYQKNSMVQGCIFPCDFSKQRLAFKKVLVFTFQYSSQLGQMHPQIEGILIKDVFPFFYSFQVILTLLPLRKTMFAKEIIKDTVKVPINISQGIMNSFQAPIFT